MTAILTTDITADTILATTDTTIHNIMDIMEVDIIQEIIITTLIVHTIEIITIMEVAEDELS